MIAEDTQAEQSDEGSTDSSSSSERGSKKDNDSTASSSPSSDDNMEYEFVIDKRPTSAGAEDVEMKNQEDHKKVKHKSANLNEAPAGAAKLLRDGENKSDNQTSQNVNPAISGQESKMEKKRSKKKSKGLGDPIKIIESVLGGPEGRRLNLSESIDKMFATNPFKSELKEELKDIRYLPTVGATLDGKTDIVTTVLPRGVRGEVNIPPSAIMKLNCINQVPEKRQRWRKGKRWGNNKNKQGNTKQEQNVSKSGSGNGKPKAAATTSLRAKEKQKQ